MSLKLLMRSLTAERYDKFCMFYRRLYSTSNAINESMPGVSLFQIKQILKQKHIAIVEGHACILIECPICDSEKSKKAKVYINKTTGKEKCHIKCITRYLIESMQVDKIKIIFSCKNLFIPGYFVCDKCSSKGEWNILEKFLSLTKSNKINMQEELETLRNAIKIHENYASKWNNIIKSNQQIADLSSESYERILNIFSLPVR